MKKAKNLIKNNIKLLIGFILGIIISAGGVYAAIVIQGSSVGYTDNYSLGATTVQGAIDKLYTMANNQYFDYATAKTNKSGRIFASSKGVCINRSGTVSCFKINNAAYERQHVREVLGSNCTDATATDGYYYCNGPLTNDIICFIYNSGKVHCLDYNTVTRCDVEANGSVSCTT